MTFRICFGRQQAYLRPLGLKLMPNIAPQLPKITYLLTEITLPACTILNQRIPRIYSL